MKQFWILFLFSKKVVLFSFGGNGNRKETGRVFGKNGGYLFVYVGVGCGKEDGRLELDQFQRKNDLLSGIQVEGLEFARLFPHFNRNM